MSIRCLIAVSTFGFLAAATPGQDQRQPRVLLVGIDRCRWDSIQYSKAKHLKGMRMIKDNTFAEATDVLGDRNTKADTASGPGCSTILLGVFADKYKV